MRNFFLFLFLILLVRDVNSLGIAAYPDHMIFQGKEKQQIIVMNPNPEQVEISVNDTAGILSFVVASKIMKPNSKTTITATPKSNGNGVSEIIVSFSTKSQQGMLMPAVFIPATISKALPATGMAVSSVQKTSNPAIGILIIVLINILGISAYFLIKQKSSQQAQPKKQTKREKNKELLFEDEPEEQEISLY